MHTAKNIQTSLVTSQPKPPEHRVDWLRSMRRRGADQELEARRADIHTVHGPKPQSLKEQALAALDDERADMSLVNYKTIRTVLELLDD